ncbi:hypothetical protein D3875_02645 [Deinococcus cavernae]|uniref:Uncharacterized protein n=1 Tax=Deinococcus cavernae TaxID=2320857 RepID=A0A418VFT1_9DEIO|nr:hypothetical protein [Deinococcus cavernae]RJF74911.1 hypothetical protein D3875_02645 [Deinococcus cavernae]
MSGQAALATVTLWAYPPQFGVKTLVPPPRPAALDYPTTAGPNAQASIDGLLITPAMVPDGGTGNPSVANVEFVLSPGDISTNVSIGILPFKDGG